MLKRALIVILCGQNVAFANTLIIEGKHYSVSLEPTRPKVCGEIGGPEYAANIFLLSSAQGLAEETYKAKCELQPDMDCSQHAIKKYGIQAVFSSIREFPSRFSSAGCAALRGECEKSCIASNAFSKEQCKVECDQFEKWTRGAY